MSNQGRILRRRFREFWLIDIDPWILGCYRLCLGSFALVFLLMLAPSWREYYGPGSISPIPLQEWKDYRPFHPLLQYVSSEAGLWLFYAASVLAAAALMAGVVTRLAVVWLWQSMVSLTFASRVNNGEEQVLSILLFFSIFLPLDASFRLDQLVDSAKRRRMFLPARKVSVWTLKVLQVHVMLIYLVSLPPKLVADRAWSDGTAVYYAMMAMDYPRWPGLEVFAWGDAIFSRTMTHATLFLEGVLPLAIWNRRLRVASTLSLIGFHVGLAVLLEGIMMFNLAMIVALLLFLPSRRTRELFRGLFYGDTGARSVLGYVVASDETPKAGRNAQRQARPPLAIRPGIVRR